MPEKRKLFIIGTIVGALNGLFGSGGGIVAVPALQKIGFDVKRAHASAIALTASMSVISAVTYYLNGYAEFSVAIRYIPGGIIGAILGASLLKKLSPSLLKRIFGIIMIVSGVRILI